MSTSCSVFLFKVSILRFLDVACGDVKMAKPTRGVLVLFDDVWIARLDHLLLMLLKLYRANQQLSPVLP